MVSPAVMFIEMAASALKREPESEQEQWLRGAQRKELKSFGDSRAKELGATGLSEDFQRGYELGLATMRVLLQGNPNAVKAGVDL